MYLGKLWEVYSLVNLYGAEHVLFLLMQILGGAFALEYYVILIKTVVDVT